MSKKYLTRMFYGSTATDKYSPMEIGNILEACRRNNPALDITGMLFLGNRYSKTPPTLHHYPKN